MKIEILKCIKCGSHAAVKNGFVGGWQRYKCKKCGYQYTKQSPQGQSVFVQILSSTLYLFGLSKREIGRIIGVSPMTVVRWIKKYHIYYMTAIAPKEKRIIMKKQDVLTMLDQIPGDEVLVIRRDLSSGGQINVLISKGGMIKNH